MRRLVLLLLCLLLLTGAVSAAEAVIDTMDIQADVSDDGSCAVTVNARLSFQQSLTAFSVPVPLQASKIAVSGCSFTSVVKDGYQLLTAKNPAGFSGTQDFLITYRLPETVTEQDAGQLLSLSLLSPGWEYSIDSLSLQVTLPKEFDALPVFQSGYYNDLIDNYMDIQTAGNALTATLTQPLMDHESLLLEMELPDGFFDLRFRSGRTASLDTVLFFALLLCCVAYWFIFLRGRLFYPKPHSMPPVGSNAGILRFQLCRKPGSFASMVLHWASMGYVRVALAQNGRVFLQRQITMGNERKSYEVAAFDALFRREDICSADSEDYRTAERLAVTGIAAFWDSKLFRKKSGSVLLLRLIGMAAGAFSCLLTFDKLFAPFSTRWLLIILLTLLGLGAIHMLQRLGEMLFSPHRKRLALCGILAALYLIVFSILSNTVFIMLINLLFQLALGIATLFGGRRTKAGQALLAELLGLRRFLRTAAPDMLSELQAQDAHYFYRTLPYAAALGASGSLCRHLGKRPLEECSWLLADGIRPKTPAAFTELYCRVLDILSRNTQSLPERLLAVRRKR